MSLELILLSVSPNSKEVLKAELFRDFFTNVASKSLEKCQQTRLENGASKLISTGIFGSLERYGAS